MFPGLHYYFESLLSIAWHPNSPTTPNSQDHSEAVTEVWVPSSFFRLESDRWNLWNQFRQAQMSAYYAELYSFRGMLKRLPLGHKIMLLLLLVTLIVGVFIAYTTESPE
mmetsp:Transcript_2939/g.4786  ORF Transcript_2939/g.4786 Transcript_2939/m.4786 type:complete len:109 (+) Transcript_2939:1561-1887(+)